MSIFEDFGDLVKDIGADTLKQGNIFVILRNVIGLCQTN